MHTGCDYDECYGIAAAVVALRSAGLYAMQGAVHQHVHVTFTTSGRL